MDKRPIFNRDFSGYFFLVLGTQPGKFWFGYIQFRLDPNVPDFDPHVIAAPTQEAPKNIHIVFQGLGA